MVAPSQLFVVTGLLVDLAGALLLVVPEYPPLQRAIGARGWIVQLRDGYRTLFDDGWLYHETDGFDRVLSVLTGYVSFAHPPDVLSVATVPRLPDPARVGSELAGTVDANGGDTAHTSILATMYFRSERRVVVAKWLEALPLESETVDEEFESFLESVEEALVDAVVPEGERDDVVETVRNELLGAVEGEFDPFAETGTQAVVGSADTVAQWLERYPSRFFVRAGALTLVVGFGLQIVGTVLVP